LTTRSVATFSQHPSTGFALPKPLLHGSFLIPFFVFRGNLSCHCSRSVLLFLATPPNPRRFFVPQQSNSCFLKTMCGSLATPAFLPFGRPPGGGSYVRARSGSPPHRTHPQTPPCRSKLHGMVQNEPTGHFYLRVPFDESEPIATQLFVSFGSFFLLGDRCLFLLPIGRSVS